MVEHNGDIFVELSGQFLVQDLCFSSIKMSYDVWPVDDSYEYGNENQHVTVH